MSILKNMYIGKITLVSDIVGNKSAMIKTPMEMEVENFVQCYKQYYR